MFKAKEKPEEKIIIELMIEDKKEVFEMCQPTFDVKAKAIETLISLDGAVHMIKAGQIIFDACYLGDLMEVKKDDDIYISVCTKAAELVKLYEGELKKN